MIGSLSMDAGGGFVKAFIALVGVEHHQKVSNLCKVS